MFLHILNLIMPMVCPAWSRTLTVHLTYILFSDQIPAGHHTVFCKYWAGRELNLDFFILNG